jgi:hypothetical protein
MLRPRTGEETLDPTDPDLPVAPAQLVGTKLTPGVEVDARDRISDAGPAFTNEGYSVPLHLAEQTWAPWRFAKEVST